MKEFLDYLVRHLVDHPEAVQITVEEREATIHEDKEHEGVPKTSGEVPDKKMVHIFHLKVAKSDIGKIIGRDGKTAASLRLLLRAVASKEGKRAKLFIEEESQHPGGAPKTG